MAETLEVIDFHDDDAPRQLTESLHRIGFALLAHHPIDRDLIAAVQAEWDAFLTGPAKSGYPFTDRQDGYYPPEVSETAKGSPLPDLKEFFQYYPWGQYPSEVSDGARRLYDEGLSLASTLLSWIDDNSPADVRQRFSTPLSQMLVRQTRTMLRILRYPPMETDETEAVRAAPHEDINLITVLPSSPEAGLEILDPRSARWIAAPPELGTVVINSGDMLKLASDGWYPSATHRVTNPTGEAARRSRVSTPLFVHPADDVLLADGRPAFSFLAERVREIRGVQIA
jgi:isopenicillin N synthase-like dioxygenase